ncbi:MAG TPA: DUF1684 domain-containing protein [Cytophagaceae bacterium]|jgi:uncharacterized protein (DUF1684 family)|nr:DUF1684 domain-containing protein [Cytophagaceae bacterium]
MKVGSYKIKTKTLIAAGILISIGFILYSIVVSGLQDRYAQSIYSFRSQKDHHFKTDENSPIEDQVGFTGLHYFEPVKKYRTEPTLIFIKDSSFVIITNNDGERNKYRRFAKAVFELDGKTDTLTIYRKASLKEEDKNYFVPFYDDTNGDETYSGGRYLDLEIRDTTSLIMDFNLAYNPYCVYNYRFSCPVPPKENRLNRRIEAGERMFVK